MNLNSIKYMMTSDSKSQTVPELIISAALIVVLFAATLSAFVFVKQMYVSSISQGNIQQDANLILSKIIKGGPEPGGLFRLSEAVSYRIQSISELHYNGTDGVERWIALSNGGTSIIYHHPTSTGTRDEVIYTAPQGAIITLRFWMPTGDVYQNINVGIDVAISQYIFGRNISGSATTIINIRNHY